MSDPQSNPEGPMKPAAHVVPNGASEKHPETTEKPLTGSAPAAPKEAVSRNAQAAAQASPSKRPTFKDEITSIIRSKVAEALLPMKALLRDEIYESTVDAETKKFVDTITNDARKYGLNRAKTEKISPRTLGNSILDSHGIKKESTRVKKGTKGSSPTNDQKGDDHGRK